MLNFSYSGAGIIKSLSVSKPADPDDTSLIIGLEMDCLIDFRNLPNVDPSGRLGDLWYREGGLIRGEFIERTVVKLKPASYLASFAFADVPDASINDVRCTTRQFSMVPRDKYQVSLSFGLVFNGNADLLVRLSNMLKVDLVISLDPEQQDLLDTEASPQTEMLGM